MCFLGRHGSQREKYSIRAIIVNTRSQVLWWNISCLRVSSQDYIFLSAPFLYIEWHNDVLLTQIFPLWRQPVTSSSAHLKQAMKEDFIVKLREHIVLSCMALSFWTLLLTRSKLKCESCYKPRSVKPSANLNSELVTIKYTILHLVIFICQRCLK